MTDSRHPLVSVIIPNYNHGRYLAAAIDSVLAQSYSPVEIIVVDNYSTDESWQVIERYAGRPVLGLRFNNGGIIAAGRNHALLRANGTFVAFLDADDTWAPDKLERQMPHFADETVALVAAESRFNGEVEYSRPAPVMRGVDYLDVTCDALIRANPIATSSVVARASRIRDAGGFDEHPDFRFIEDWELWLRLCRVGRLRMMTATLINYRLAVGTGRDLRDVALRKLRVVAKHSTPGAFGPKTLRRATGNIFVDVGRACLDVGDREGVRYYVRGLRMCDSARRWGALVGLFLFSMPLSIRRVIIRGLYNLRFAFGRSRGHVDNSQVRISG
jgi:glycosyltransferase involved in cell wall biosynthesis